MGISHPLSDEFYGGGGGGGGAMLMMSPERSPPSSPPAVVDGQDDFLEHEVSRMDTLAGIAIKYGVEMDAALERLKRGFDKFKTDVYDKKPDFFEPLKAGQAPKTPPRANPGLPDVAE